MISKNNKEKETKIVLEGEQLEQVKQFSYLGSLITQDGRCIEEVKRRIGQAKDSFWRCKEFLRGDLNLKRLGSWSKAGREI